MRQRHLAGRQQPRRRADQLGGGLAGRGEKRQDVAGVGRREIPLTAAHAILMKPKRPRSAVAARYDAPASGCATVAR